MKLDVKAIHLQGALHGLRELADADHLIVHSEQSLIAVAWPDLRNIPDGLRVVLGPPGQGKVLATDVAVDDAWIVEPKAHRVLLAREGEFSSIDTAGKTEVHHIPVHGLPVGTFAAALDSAGQRVLLVVLRVVNIDFANYAVAVADLANGWLVTEGTIGSGSDLELLWDATLSVWVIGDTNRGALWRWDGASPAVKLAGPTGGPIHAATFAETAAGVIVSALSTLTTGALTTGAQATGATALVTGHAQRDRVVWAAPVALPGSAVLMARRHPARTLWACLAQEGTAQRIQIRDETGKISAQADLRPGVYLNDLLWSASSPDRFWGVGIRGLASATIHE
jgi:hypothetical protein